MNSLKTVKILLSPLCLHSASSIQIPQSTNRYNSMLPSVYVSPLKLHSVTKINLHGVSDSALFRNHLKKTISFQGFRGVQHFPGGGGGSNFFQMLISIETHITFDCLAAQTEENSHCFHCGTSGFSI